MPWKQIKDHPGDFIYLPKPRDDLPLIDDLGDMKKEQIARLLEHWRRLVPTSDLFRFRFVLVNSKINETMPASYIDLFAGQPSLPPNTESDLDDMPLFPLPDLTPDNDPSPALTSLNQTPNPTPVNNSCVPLSPVIVPPLTQVIDTQNIPS